MKIGVTLIPDRESDAPEVLSAWYHGTDCFYQAYRKVVLAALGELLRAQFDAQGVKVTEKRLDDRARTHGIYLQFLETHLAGMQRYEKMWLEMRGAQWGAS